MADRTFSGAVKDALGGIVQSLRNERNLQTQVALGAIAIAVAAVLHFRPIQWAVLALAIGVVLGAELTNTALEHLVDLVQPEQHELARAVKHAAAAAVLVAALAALAAGVWLYGSAFYGW